MGNAEEGCVESIGFKKWLWLNVLVWFIWIGTFVQCDKCAGLATRELNLFD